MLWQQRNLQSNRGIPLVGVIDNHGPVGSWGWMAAQLERHHGAAVEPNNTVILCTAQQQHLPRLGVGSFSSAGYKYYS